MNIWPICNPLCTRLTVKHTSSLMFVSLSGLLDMLFEPLKYVKSWLVLNRRSAINSEGPARKQEVDATNEMKSLWKIFYLGLCLSLFFLACAIVHVM
jgi:hypothetical protein